VTAMGNEAQSSQRNRGLLVAGLVLAVAFAGTYAYSQDKDFFVDMFKALFGLAGGNTAGGQ